MAFGFDSTMVSRTSSFIYLVRKKRERHRRNHEDELKILGKEEK